MEKPEPRMKRRLLLRGFIIALYSLFKFYFLDLDAQANGGEVSGNSVWIFLALDIGLLIIWAFTSYRAARFYQQSVQVYIWMNLHFFIAFVLSVILSFAGEYGPSLSGALVMMYFYYPFIHLLPGIIPSLENILNSGWINLITPIILLLSSGAGIYLYERSKRD